MVYGVLLLIKMKNSSSSSRSRSSSRSSSRATSPVRTTGTSNAHGPDPPHGKDRRPLSWGASPVSSLCEDFLGTPDATLKPKITKTKEKSPCFSTSPHASRRMQKPLHRSRSSSGSSVRTGSPTGAAHKRNTSSAIPSTRSSSVAMTRDQRNTFSATPALRATSATPATRVSSAAMTRDQRIRRWLQGLNQESLEASIPEEDVPGREDSLEEEGSHLPSEIQGSSIYREASVPTWQTNGKGFITQLEQDKSK